GDAPDEREVIRFLSELACAGRWAHDRDAIHLRLSKSGPRAAEGESSALNFADLADGLRYWLDEHPAHGPFETEGYAPPPFEPFDDLAQLVQFAVSAGLIEISLGGILSFRHELIAEYFVAEYFYVADTLKRTTTLPIHESLLRDVASWSGPVALWAGLLDNPLVLAERFGAFALNNPAYMPQAIALSLVCVGVAWVLPEDATVSDVVLTESVAEALATSMRSKTSCAELARYVTSCAEEGGEEVYQALFPLVMVDGIEELLARLDSQLVAELLFGYLQDIVDSATHEAQVKRLARVLGRFGHEVVERANMLCLPAPERSLRLRAAAINILGGTNDAEAVEPLIARLSDADVVIVERATNGLIRLGPALTLTRVLQVIEKQEPGPLLLRVHCAALTIVGRFLADEKDGPRHVGLQQYQSILERLVPVLGSAYQSEGDAQRLAREILVRQGRSTVESSEQEQRVQKLIELLVRALVGQNESGARNISLVLQEIGASATPALLELLAQPETATRLHVIEILQSVRDTRALPQLLQLMSEPAVAIQQRVAEILQIYAPESIPGLLDLVLHAADEMVAERAASVLAAIGETVVEPVTAVLGQIVPGRTRLLVQVLEQTHQTAALPALISLLETPELEPLLAIAVVRALSQFSDARVVAPLLTVLSSSYPQLYEEAIDSLSQLGEVALQKLLAALDTSEETVATARIRRAILGMSPFPGIPLVRTWGRSSEQQARQVKEIMKAQGSEAAQVLVRHLLDNNERVRERVIQTLHEMSGAVVVPALLDALSQPTQRRVVSNILLDYPDAAIVPLVGLLGEAERGDTSSALLPQFGVQVLRPLLAAFDDTRPGARERGQRIIVALVRQSEDPQGVLRELIQLFNPAPTLRAREVLLGVLSSELADVSLPVLLEGMDDAYLLESVSEVFVRLARRPALYNTVVDALLQALYREDQRRGAATALIKIGAPVVTQVGELITDADPAVAKIARDILREIGVPSLSFIWSAHSDTQNIVRREAALEVFHKMRTETIKDELVSLLVSSNPDNIGMAVALLLERIHDEEIQRYADHVMVPELVEYIQMHGLEETNLRVVALLLMLGEHAVINYLIQTLDEYPEHRKQLVYTFLLLGRETEDALQEVFVDQNTSPELRAELATVLGMMSAPEEVAEYAQNISKYGLAPQRSGTLYPDQLTIGLRALGGLLAGGYWDTRTLQELRASSTSGSPEHELFSILLGWRYAPQVEQLQKDLAAEKEAHNTEVVKLSARIIADQKRIHTLEDDLEASQQEHGSRDEEMEKAAADLETLNEELEQMSMERDRLRGQLQRAVGEIKHLREQVYQLGGELPERRSRPSRPSRP
ncbi:MAG TPA: HEAT repeat domain-containing protein, partial [Ktedonobacteraceae bacterium]